MAVRRRRPHLRDSRKLSLLEDHLAVPAVEVEGEPLSVVEKVQWSCFLASVVLRAHSELVSDAVLRAHEFCGCIVLKFICRSDRLGSA